MRRLLVLALACLVTGCGGGDTAQTGSADDPAGVLPPGLPLVVKVSADLNSDQWQAALDFAGRVDPSDRDLGKLLREELQSEDVSFEEDIEPWLGDEAAIGLEGIVDGEPIAVVAVQTTDADATIEALDKGSERRPVSYQGVDYGVDEGGAASGIIGDFLVEASDEAHFKAAVDASEGESIADDAAYADTLAMGPADSLAQAYFDVDGFLELLVDTGVVPPDTLDAVEATPGFEPGQSAVAAVVADDDRMTLELAADPTDAELPEGPEIADLPGQAWLAVAGGVAGENLFAGIEQGISQSGVPGADQAIERLGIRPFLESVEGVSLRLGGTELTALNGELTLTGSDAAAASDVVERVTAEVRALGAPVEVDQNTATLSVPPYEVRLSADGEEVSLAAGNPPEQTLGDDDAFKAAADALGLDEVVLFADFGPIEELVRNLPADSDTEDALPVLGELGYLVAGSEVDDDTARTRVVLTLR